MSNNLTTPGNAPLPALEEDDYGKGLGKPSAFSRNNLMISVAQPLTRALNEDDPGYIEGLEVSDIYIKNALNPIYKTGIDVIPVWAKDVHVEWLPDRQGFVAEYDTCPDDAENVSDNPRRPILIRKSNGDQIVPTRNIYVLVLPELLPCVLPCWSTRLTFAATWEFRMRQQRDRETGRQLPPFAKHYLLQTVLNKKQQGRWYGLQAKELGPTTDEQAAAAREFRKFVEGGNFRITADNVDAN
jgi:hypothetical protein